MSENPESCPCESGKTYAQCCGRYIDDGQAAPIAEALMRSRFTAYVKSRQDYLSKTWHASTRPATLSLNESQPDRWLGLKIIKTEQGLANDTHGVVEFIARYKVNGKAGRLHEVSEFKREADQWFYVKGTLLE